LKANGINPAVAIEPRMEAWPVFFRALTLLLSSFVFCFTAYRAAMQAIAHDEALTYLWFLDGGIGRVLVFDTNNHVLYTLLAKVIVRILGLTELSLRSVSLAGCLIYLVAAFLLCRRLFGDTLLLPVTVALLVLNPLVMDFLAAARGYGLGLAFLTSATYVLIRIIDDGNSKVDNATNRRRCAIAAVLLALSAAANLCYLIPAISLACSLLAITSWFPERDWRSFGKGLWAFTRFFVLPGVAAGLFILWPFLIQVRPRYFFFGYARIGDAVRDIFNSSLLYRWTDDPSASVSLAVSATSNGRLLRLSNLGTFFIAPALVVCLIGALVLLWHTAPRSSWNSKSRALLFVSATLGCVALILVLHFIGHMKYPLSRTSLYAIPLCSISAILVGGVVREVCSGSTRTLLTSAGMIIMLAVVADYAVSLNRSYFRYNAYDRRSRELFLALVQDARARQHADLRIAGIWWYQPEIDFYRQRYGTTWLLPYDIKDASWPWQAANSLTPADYDYFLYTADNQPDLSGHHLRPIFSDSATKLALVAIDK